MAEKIPEAGQLETEPGSPPGTEDPGAKVEDSPTSKEASVEDTSASKEKPAPYDDDPKWKAARAAEARSDAILKKYDLDDFDDIEDALEDIGKVRKDLGDQDLKQLIKDQKELKALQSKMDKDKRSTRDADETLDERAERLERENEDLKGARSKDTAEKEAYDASVKAIKTFNSEVSKVLDSEEVPKERRDILKVFLGVDNPVDEVDTGNKREVRRMAKERIKTFNDFLEIERQKAVDAYASGKSKLTPTRKAKVPAEKPVKKTEIPDGMSVDEAQDKFFKDKSKELFEGMMKGVETT